MGRRLYLCSWVLLFEYVTALLGYLDLYMYKDCAPMHLRLRDFMEPFNVFTLILGHSVSPFIMTVYLCDISSNK